MTRFIRALILLIALAHPFAAHAESYPSRTITIVVTSAAGGITDVIARAIGQRLSAAWGQTIVIENKGGAGHSIGASAVAKAVPDGYTLMFTTMGVLAVNPHTSAKVTFDTFKDFTYISTVASTPHVIAVNPSVAAKTLPELVALARSKPEGLSFGTAGIGSSPSTGTE